MALLVTLKIKESFSIGECHKFTVSFPFSVKEMVLNPSGTSESVSIVKPDGFPSYPNRICPFLASLASFQSF